MNDSENYPYFTVRTATGSALTFADKEITMYLCTGFSQNTYAKDTSGYIVGTYIMSD